MRTSLPAVTKGIPSIMIWGENDIFAAPELGRELEGMLPDVKFHWIERAGHQVQTDRPEVVADIIRRFMNGPASPNGALAERELASR